MFLLFWWCWAKLSRRQSLSEQCKTLLNLPTLRHLNELFAERCHDANGSNSQEGTLNAPLNIWSSFKPVVYLLWDRYLLLWFILLEIKKRPVWFSVFESSATGRNVLISDKMDKYAACLKEKGCFEWLSQKWAQW